VIGFCLHFERHIDAKTLKASAGDEFGDPPIAVSSSACLTHLAKQKRLLPTQSRGNMARNRSDIFWPVSFAHSLTAALAIWTRAKFFERPIESPQFRHRLALCFTPARKSWAIKVPPQSSH
jgi:hypothetical protein